MRARWAASALALLGPAHLVACGIDGVTADCSDAATCAPSYGDAALAVLDAEAGPAPDDAPGDAIADADGG